MVRAGGERRGDDGCERSPASQATRAAPRCCERAPRPARRPSFLLTDPPYCLLTRRRKGGDARERRPGRKIDRDPIHRFEDVRAYRRFTAEWLPAAARSVVDGGTLAIWTNFLGPCAHPRRRRRGRLPRAGRRVPLGQADHRGRGKRAARPGVRGRAGAPTRAASAARARRPRAPLGSGGRLRRGGRGRALGKPSEPQALRGARAAAADLVTARRAGPRLLRREREHPGGGGQARARRGLHRARAGVGGASQRAPRAAAERRAQRGGSSSAFGRKYGQVRTGCRG